MKKLIFYSDQITGKKQNLDKELLKLINKENPKLGYIPSCSDFTRKYYNQKVEYYERLGINSLTYFDLDKDFDGSKVSELLECDAIHLSGGDTAYFLSNIRKRNFDVVLKDYVNSGGVLIGISAGSIIMTETIDIVTIGNEFIDNYDLKNMKGLGLVDFEFMPHWDRGIYKIEEFLAYSIESRRSLYLCNDGDGIIVNDNDIDLVGEFIKIENGMTYRIKGQ